KKSRSSMAALKAGVVLWRRDRSVVHDSRDRHKGRRSMEVASARAPSHSSAMREVAYLFERFPSFGQTFCYREVAELERQGTRVHVFSIRRPVSEPAQDWDKQIVDRVHYLPEEKTLVPEAEAALRQKPLSGAPRTAIQQWGRQSDFLRLYQAIYVGKRL